MSTWTTPAILEPENEERAVAHLAAYFAGAAYTGSYFERLGGGGDAGDVVDRVTSEDLVALAMLSVPVSGAAARLLLVPPLADQLTALLRQIPSAEPLSSPDGRGALADDGPAAQLWTLVRTVPTFGPVRTSKLLARKRPHLIPIYDDVVREQFGAVDSRGQWSAWRALVDDEARVTHLEHLRERSRIGDDISLLRVLDVVVWMEGSVGNGGSSVPPDTET